EAEATVQRMKAIDPAAEPRTAGGGARRGQDSLVFLDLNDAQAPAKRRSSAVARSAMQGLELLSTGLDTPAVSPAIPASSMPTPAANIATSPAPTPELLDTPLLDPPVLDGVTRVAEFER